MNDASFINDSTAWRGADFRKARSWVFALDNTMRDEIVEATKAVEQTDDQILEKVNFPLPLMSEVLRSAYDELEFGRGFTVIANFPVEHLTVQEARIAYEGVASYLGGPIVQNGGAERMVDVRDIGRDYSHQSRGYSGTALLPFHTDGTKGEPQMLHYTGLLCLETASEGGLSAIASATSLYNKVIAQRPDLMPSLLRGYHHHRQGDHPPGHAPISAERIPVFSFSNGLLHCRYNRNNMVWAAREGAEIGSSDLEAFDLIDSILSREGFALSMNLQKGDLQIINNSVILHSRSEYIDASDRKRHLLRLWLNNPQARRDGHNLVELFASPESRFSDKPWRAV